jgi:hypothetical protein
MLARTHITIVLAVSVWAQGVGLAGMEPFLPNPVPPSQTEQAYYYSTLGFEQAMTTRRNAPDAGTVPQWGCFEVAVANPRSYANPYEDVTLAVTFTRPDSSTVAFWGFYDGGNTWRIRLMPDQTGTWRYQARFSDGAAQADGTFTCVGSDIPGMISAYHANPMWFGFKDGDAVLVRSLQVGERFLAEGGAGDALRREMFLDWAQSQGYNMLSIAGCLPNRDSGSGGQVAVTSALWDADRQQPNPPAYRRLESLLGALAARQMMVYPASGFFGRDSEFPRGQANQDLYLRYTLARLGSYWNMVWIVGGPEPLRGSDPYLSREEIDRLGRRIKAMDPFGHLLCVSNAAGNDVFKDAGWTSCGVLQGPRTANLRRLSRVLLQNHSSSKPLYAQQTLWPGSRRQADYSADELRKDAYVLMMSGAMVNLADMGGSPASGLSGTLDLSQRVQARHDIVKQVWDFFGSIPFWRMTPRQDLVDNGYCLAEPGRMYLVYLDAPGTVTVDITDGMYRVKWIDARNTADVREAGIISSRRDLTSPQEEDDWLLSLTRVEIVAGEIRPY